MEKLLFFGLTDAEFQKIKPVASRLKLHCEQIPVSMYHNTLGAIASGRAVPAGIPAAPGTPVPASLTAALGADAPAGASAVSAACGIPEAGSTPAAVSRDRLSCASCPSAGWTSCSLNCAASTPPSTTRLYSRPQTPDGRFHVFSWKCTQKKPLTPQKTVKGTVAISISRFALISNIIRIPENKKFQNKQTAAKSLKQNSRISSMPRLASHSVSLPRLNTPGVCPTNRRQ